MANPELSLGEIIVGDEPNDSPDELLYRQVTPHTWINDEGTPASHAFGPSKADKGMPSYSRGSKVTAQQAFDWHNAHAHSPSVGTWACSLDEVHAAELRVIDDSQAFAAGPKAPGHCYVDFRGLTKSEERNRRSVLLRHALARGIVYPDAPQLPKDKNLS